MEILKVILNSIWNSLVNTVLYWEHNYYKAVKGLERWLSSEKSLYCFFREPKFRLQHTSHVAHNYFKLQLYWIACPRLTSMGSWIQMPILMQTNAHMDGILCPLAHLSTGILSDLKLWRSYACCHNLCEFISVSVHLYLEDKVFLLSSIFSHFYNLYISSNT